MNKREMEELDLRDWDVLWELAARQGWVDSLGSHQYIHETQEAIRRGTIKFNDLGHLVLVGAVELR